MAAEQGQQHPLRTYLWIWLWLFIFSVGSYIVDISPLADMVKWSLITFFMLLKAGLIIAVFMHMVWERMSIVTAVLVPAGVLVFLMFMMIFEGYYILGTRLTFFST